MAILATILELIGLLLVVGMCFYLAWPVGVFVLGVILVLIGAALGRRTETRK